MLRYAREKGFTLIEMMIVIVIVGIGVSVATLVISRGGPEDDLRQIVTRFTAVAEFASERAILTGQPVGLLLEPPAWREEMDQNLEKSWRYRWQLMGRAGWQDEAGIPTVELPPSVHLDVTVEDQIWEWEEAPEIRLPIAVFYPSGEVTPFVIEFRDERLPDYKQTVEVDVWGQVVWRERPQPERELNGGF